MKVKILRGLPGSGKSTYAAMFLKALVCSADNYFTTKDGKYNFNPNNLGEAHTECLKTFLLACKNHKDLIIVDNTNVTTLEIAPYVAIAQAYGYDVEIIMFYVSITESITRNIHNVPTQAIENMAKNWGNVFPRHWPEQEIISDYPVF